jgi:3-oxoacyl-[acyl-carrier-protein] synthase-3
MNIKITGSGCYIPEIRIKNIDFYNHRFLNEDGSPFGHPNELVVGKFKSITGIDERRYVTENLTTSDIAYFAAKKAIETSKTDPETIDYIILAHNFGDIKSNTSQSDMVPCLAARVKHQLQIQNPKCVAFDILFGCPGWIQGMLQAYAFIKSGMAKKCLVIGAETLSRVVDPHDRDAMIFADGAGATLVEITNEEGGIIAHKSASYTLDEIHFLFYGKSFNPELDSNIHYIKMQGRKIYEFALNQVPKAMKSCLDQTGIPIDQVKKILIHQANEKMDEAIINRFYKLYDKKTPEGIMPMSINFLGNSSVATIPTLYDLIINGKIENQELHKGDVIIFASVGAGMNINAIVYKY